MQPDQLGRNNRHPQDAVRYTTVGEGHAFYDAKAAFDYSDTLSSTFGVAVSVDGKVWTVMSKVSRKNSAGHSTGFTGQGPYWAKQWRVPIESSERDAEFNCPVNRHVHSYSIVPVKYKVPAGGATGAYGADVRSHDGANAYSRSPAQNRGVIPRGAYFAINKGQSITYSAAVKVFNVELSLDTDYNKSHSQRITVGNGPQEHDIWGAHGPVSSNPGVLYSF